MSEALECENSLLIIITHFNELARTKINQMPILFQIIQQLF